MTESLKEAHRTRWRSRALRFSLWLVLGGIFSWYILAYSMRLGRLAVPPAFDDVVYLGDGMRRLHIFQQDGFRALIQDYLNNATHSPYSSGMAFLGFAIFGHHNWAPYLTNAILIFGMLVGIDALSSGRPLWEKAGLGIFALTVPMMGYAVHEFRPDAPAAWCGAACAGVILSGPWLTASRLRLVLAGAFAGLSLIVKPTFGPLMLCLFGLEMLLVTVRDRLDAPAEWTVRKALRACLLASGVALAVALPYYAVNLGHLIDYYAMVYGAYIPLRKESGLGLVESALFYVNGQGADYTLRRHAYVWLTLLLAGGIYSWRIRGGVAWRQVAVWALTIGAVYFAVGINQLRSTFLGLPFQTILLVALLTYLVWVFRELEARGVRKGIRVMVMLILLVVGYKSFKLPPKWNPPRHNRGNAWNSASENLHKILHSRDEGTKSLFVFFTITGDINFYLMNYLDYKDRLPVHITRDCSLSADPSEYKAQMDQADWVVASESDNPAISPQMPSTLFADESLCMVRERNDFECVGEVPIYEGKKFFVFHRRYRTSASDNRAVISAP